MRRHAAQLAGAPLILLSGCFGSQGPDTRASPSSDAAVDAGALQGATQCDLLCTGTATGPDGTTETLFVRLETLSDGTALTECFISGKNRLQEPHPSCLDARAMGCGVGPGVVIDSEGPTTTRRVEYVFGTEQVEVTIIDQIVAEAEPFPPVQVVLPYANCRPAHAR